MNACEGSGAEVPFVHGVTPARCPVCQWHFPAAKEPKTIVPAHEAVGVCGQKAPFTVGTPTGGMHEVFCEREAGHRWSTHQARPIFKSAGRFDPPIEWPNEPTLREAAGELLDVMDALVPQPGVVRKSWEHPLPMAATGLEALEKLRKALGHRTVEVVATEGVGYDPPDVRLKRPFGPRCPYVWGASAPLGPSADDTTLGPTRCVMVLHPTTIEHVWPEGCRRRYIEHEDVVLVPDPLADRWKLCAHCGGVGRIVPRTGLPPTPEEGAVLTTMPCPHCTPELLAQGRSTERRR